MRAYAVSADKCDKDEDDCRDDYESNDFCSAVIVAIIARIIHISHFVSQLAYPADYRN